MERLPRRVHLAAAGLRQEFEQVRAPTTINRHRHRHRSAVWLYGRCHGPKTIVELEDDVDGGLADETICFGLDGQNYEIDLNAKNAAAFRAVLATYTDAARRTGSARRGVAPRRAVRVHTDVDPTAVRAWANSNGGEVNQRGRLSKNVMAQFREAGN
jgi:hypothetical protein